MTDTTKDTSGYVLKVNLESSNRIIVPTDYVSGGKLSTLPQSSLKASVLGTVEQEVLLKQNTHSGASKAFVAALLGLGHIGTICREALIGKIIASEVNSKVQPGTHEQWERELELLQSEFMDKVFIGKTMEQCIGQIHSGYIAGEYIAATYAKRLLNTSQMHSRETMDSISLRDGTQVTVDSAGISFWYPNKEGFINRVWHSLESMSENVTTFVVDYQHEPEGVSAMVTNCFLTKQAADKHKSLIDEYVASVILLGESVSKPAAVEAKN